MLNKNYIHFLSQILQESIRQQGVLREAFTNYLYARPRTLQDEGGRRVITKQPPFLDGVTGAQLIPFFRALPRITEYTVHPSHGLKNLNSKYPSFFNENHSYFPSKSQFLR